MGWRGFEKEDLKLKFPFKKPGLCSFFYVRILSKARNAVNETKNKVECKETGYIFFKVLQEIIIVYHLQEVLERMRNFSDVKILYCLKPSFEGNLVRFIQQANRTWPVSIA